MNIVIVKALLQSHFALSKILSCPGFVMLAAPGRQAIQSADRLFYFVS
jgi:hypothetical protein